MWPFDKPQYLILNLAIGGAWGGQKGVDDAIFPARYEIEYGAVFQTKISGSMTTSVARHQPVASGLVVIVLVAIAAAQDRNPARTSDSPCRPASRSSASPHRRSSTGPSSRDFDDEGRLYVADSSGSSDRVEKQLADWPHRIVRLEDVDRDGTFDTSVVFADRMMLPEDTMWFDGSLYVAAPPSIWRLTDTNGDGVADEREEWFRGETLTGCANDPARSVSRAGRLDSTGPRAPSPNRRTNVMAGRRS